MPRIDMRKDTVVQTALDRVAFPCERGIIYTTVGGAVGHDSASGASTNPGERFLREMRRLGADREFYRRGARG